LARVVIPFPAGKRPSRAVTRSRPRKEQGGV
jgi:hypothetical protein